MVLTDYRPEWCLLITGMNDACWSWQKYYLFNADVTLSVLIPGLHDAY